MSGLGNANVGTTAVREGFEFDTDALSRWMSQHVEGFNGPVRVEQFKGGQSNPTYKLISPSGSYVLRRKPAGQLLKGAHAVDREARVLQALSHVNFPVARVYGLCTEESIIGTWFYVMAMVEGRIFWDASLADVRRGERAKIFDSMNCTIARLHGIDYQALGLGDYGRSGSYVAKQIERWSRQYFHDELAGRDPNMDRVIEWLTQNIPDNEETSIVHGDFRIDNLIFHPSEPRVLAVLDWELSTLGHPGCDFAYHAMMYRMPPELVAGLAHANLEQLGLPSEAEYLAAYCTRTGRDVLPGYDYYIAFNFFRLAAIFHGIKGRYIRGTAASAQACSRAALFPELARLAWREALRAGAS